MYPTILPQTVSSPGTFVGINTTNPRNNFHNAGGAIVNVTTESGAGYAVQPSDRIVAYTGVFTKLVVLPTAADATRGRVVTIKDQLGTASEANPIPITPNAGTVSGQTIDGVGTIYITTSYGSVNVYSNGTQWFTY